MNPTDWSYVDDDEPWHLYVIEEPRRIPWGLLALVAVVALIAWRKK